MNIDNLTMAELKQLQADISKKIINRSDEQENALLQNEDYKLLAEEYSLLYQEGRAGCKVEIQFQYDIAIKSFEPPFVNVSSLPEIKKFVSKLDRKYNLFKTKVQKFAQKNQIDDYQVWGLILKDN